MSDIIDTISDTIVSELDAVSTPIHEELKNMSGDEFSWVILTIFVLILMLVGWVVAQQCAVRPTS